MSVGIGAPRVGSQDPVVQVLLVVQRDVRLPEVCGAYPGPALLHCFLSFTWKPGSHHDPQGSTPTESQSRPAWAKQWQWEPRWSRGPSTWAPLPGAPPVDRCHCHAGGVEENMKILGRKVTLPVVEWQTCHNHGRLSASALTMDCHLPWGRSKSLLAPKGALYAMVWICKHPDFQILTETSTSWLAVVTSVTQDQFCSINIIQHHIMIWWSIWVRFPRTGKMSNMWHFFLVFDALLWPNGWIFSSFLNCSEENMSVRP